MEGASDGLAEHLLKFDRLIRELKESGAAVEESDAVCHLLLTLPASFDPVITAIETLPGGVTMAFVKNRLIDVNLKKRNLMNGDSDSEDVAMMGRFSRGRIKCFRCGKFGHRAADCRVRTEEDTVASECERVKVRNRKTNIAIEDDRGSDCGAIVFVATKEEHTVKTDWLLDSGATEHMVKDASYLSEIRRLKRPVEVVIANGEKLLADYCGDMVMYTDVAGKKKKCEAKNVLYVPGLKSNLFSVNRIARSGLQVKFFDNRAELIKNDEVMATAHYTGKQYEMKMMCGRRY